MNPTIKDSTSLQHLFWTTKKPRLNQFIGVAKKEKDYPLEVPKESFVYCWSERAVPLSLWSLWSHQEKPWFSKIQGKNCNFWIAVQLIIARRWLELQELKKCGVSGHKTICQQQPKVPCYGHSFTVRHTDQVREATEHNNLSLTVWKTECITSIWLVHKLKR